ncbi:MAG: bifunctional diaminohydroxyphosphoribosylaminopyrimidine deaminase/5-amino-6-(5-phosphoribosylamino)uracil reductase RibD [Brachyspira sp.]|nr:bifunctional diaminohydroxyphosphoribosylaminopyrimidine deaminase/5-amino-6-(5-phosphoribosylamino)uracil reductase RibD [Brachyspira sp.]
MDYEKSMKKCINLALKGAGSVSPNPLVGCVVYNRDGVEVSTGYHKKYGDNHAERDALLKLGQDDTIDGTLVVNLEPCSHYGKTPPCADLIIERGIKRVVIGMRDVNPVVAGNGVKKLKDAGVEVIENILSDDCRKLNEVFIKNMTMHKTFVAIKTASTLDGKVASSTGSSKWITSSNARDEVKNIRNKYDAILTSSATVITDNPSMVHRCNIILDRELKTVGKYKIYDNNRVIVFYDETLQSPVGSAEFIKTPIKSNNLDLEFVFNNLFEMGIMSVLVEAGGHLNGSVLKFADKIYHFIAPKVLGDNSGLSCFDFRRVEDINLCANFRIDSVQQYDPDILLTYYPN